METKTEGEEEEVQDGVWDKLWLALDYNVEVGCDTAQNIRVGFPRADHK